MVNYLYTYYIASLNMSRQVNMTRFPNQFFLFDYVNNSLKGEWHCLLLKQQRLLHFIRKFNSDILVSKSLKSTGDSKIPPSL